MYWKFIILLLLIGEACGEIARKNTKYYNVAYFVNWAIYGRNFTPQQIPAAYLTHVLYAFADVHPDTGEVFLTDPWADTDKHFDGDSWNEIGSNVYSCFRQLYLLKKQNRHLKTLLSIGGWTYSSHFRDATSSASARSTFASSATTLMINLGLDGLDIDWEYPVDDFEARNFVLLLQETRKSLDTVGNSLNPPYHFKLSVACPAGPTNYKTLHLSEMDQYVDWWNFMGYDYAGAWSSVAANQANIFASGEIPATTPFMTDAAIDYYVSNGVAPSKLIIGLPLYGRSFEATDGLGKPFKGVGPGTWDAGAYVFKVLPLSGAIEVYDNLTGSSYSYRATKHLISYDTLLVVDQKAAWIKQKGLGGAMWWEMSGDQANEGSLIRNLQALLGPGMDASPNQLVYHNSAYDNMRAGMPEMMNIGPVSEYNSLSDGSSSSTMLTSTTVLLREAGVGT